MRICVIFMAYGYNIVVWPEFVCPEYGQWYQLREYSWRLYVDDFMQGWVMVVLLEPVTSGLTTDALLLTPRRERGGR